MSERKIPKLHFWSSFFVLLMVMLAFVLFKRYTQGIGSISNLNDSMPWGLWIGFDLLCGVALGAGGFTVTAVVYIFHLEDYRPMARPAVLTAFLGYLMVIAALLVDLGRPWNIWHPLVFWNPHSVMFEVGWCVMLYTTVLFLEFIPLVFERLGYNKQVHFMHKYLTPGLVIAGVLLSTMHQSSLGTLYVIVPEKLHPLWYSPILPILFFVSAITLGLAMTNVESFISFRALGKRLESNLLRGIGRATAVMLMIYLVIRIEDLIVHDSLKYAFRFDTASWFFLAEIIIGGIVPMVLLFQRRIRENKLALTGTQFLVVLGIIFNRMNVAVTAFQLGTGTDYRPHWMEFVVSMGMIAIGVFLFSLAARYLPVFVEEGPLGKSAGPKDPYAELS
ncbi:Ni/Fe-hydrogenase cytochrome b subunit [bacterium CG_4_9_14_3_um_filter_65_15]|nr:MAG: Ni/Fe-hydrogenase cytochrome b subunit [bacterium CG_4_9_14_3_um_filter_65_15]